jgi:hypothetical protein
MIEGYLGRVGAGKTYCMVERVRKYIGKRQIFTNMTLPWAEHIDSIEDMVGVSDGILMLDEAGVWFSSREYSQTKGDALRFFAQTRKQGLHMFYTVQHEAGVDAAIRRLTSIMYRHTRYGKWIVQTGHDADSMERFQVRLVPITKSVYDLYDTFEVIGDGKGGKGGHNSTGAMRKKLNDKLVNGFIDGALVRCCDDLGNPTGLRRASPDDVWQGAEIWKFDEEAKGFVLVDTSDYRPVGLVKEDSKLLVVADEDVPRLRIA